MRIKLRLKRRKRNTPASVRQSRVTSKLTRAVRKDAKGFTLLRPLGVDVDHPWALKLQVTVQVLVVILNEAIQKSHVIKLMLLGRISNLFTNIGIAKATNTHARKVEKVIQSTGSGSPFVLVNLYFLNNLFDLNARRVKRLLIMRA
jgi:hypothetical protein